MNPQTVLWIYIILLVIGGLIGFLKAGSKASLIASVSFAALLSLKDAAHVAETRSKTVDEIRGREPREVGTV